MNYLLSTHERAYNISLYDGLLSAGTLCSGAPYAKRHWDLSNRLAEHCLGHRIIAVLQAIPVIGLLFCLIERIVAWVASRPIELPPQQVARLPVPVQKVALQNGRQYDMPGNQPAACTFHAISAMKEICSNFDNTFNLIANGRNDRLSAFQRDVILNKGLPLYQRALAQNPRFVEGADIQQVLPFLPAGINLQQPPNHDELQPFNQRLNLVVGHLFGENPPMKTVWLKTGNEESFAVISTGTRAIIFDSHKNEIIATETEEGARAALREKLTPFMNEMDGVDVTPFAYALTDFEQIPAPQAEPVV